MIKKILKTLFLGTIKIAFVAYVLVGFTIGILHAEKVVEGKSWMWYFTVPYFAGRGMGYGFFIYVGIVTMIILLIRLFNYLFIILPERKQQRGDR